MKKSTIRKFLDYVYGNFAGNFLGFVIGLASARLVSRFFATRSIRNLWGLTTSKTVVDKKTFNAMEWMISVVIGFIVFEIISKWVKKQIDQMLPKYRLTKWLAEPTDIKPRTVLNDDPDACKPFDLSGSGSSYRRTDE